MSDFTLQLYIIFIFYTGEEMIKVKNGFLKCQVSFKTTLVPLNKEVRNAILQDKDLRNVRKRQRY